MSEEECLGKLEPFMAELEALLKRHGVSLYACSCCQGLNVTDSEGDTLAANVRVADSGDVEEYSIHETDEERQTGAYCYKEIKRERASV